MDDNCKEMSRKLQFATSYHGTPFYYFNTTFAYVTERNKIIISNNSEDEINIDTDKYYRTFKHKTKLSFNFYSNIQFELLYDDLIDLVKINILMCKNISYISYYDCPLDFPLYIYPMLKTLKHRIYLFKNRTNECAFRLLHNNFIIKPINNVYLRIILISMNGETKIHISLDKLIDVIKSMNLNIELYFTHFDNYQLINFPSTEDNLILKDFGRPKSETVDKLNEYLNCVFGENKELVLTYFTYLFKNFHKCNLKILNFVMNKRNSYYFEFMELIHKAIHKLMEYDTANNIINKLKDDKRINKKVLFHTFGIESTDNNNIKKLINISNKINEYIITKSHNFIYNKNIINIECSVNDVYTEFHNVTEYTRALIDILINYKIKPEILKILLK